MNFAPFLCLGIIKSIVMGSYLLWEKYKFEIGNDKNRFVHDCRLCCIVVISYYAFFMIVTKKTEMPMWSCIFNTFIYDHDAADKSACKGKYCRCINVPGTLINVVNAIYLQIL